MSYVYFARVGGYVKIGFSYRPNERVKHFFNGAQLLAPEDLDRTQPVELIHTLPECTMQDERVVHRMFDDHRVAGEWFQGSVTFYRDLHRLRYVTVAETRRIARRERIEAKRRLLQGDAA